MEKKEKEFNRPKKTDTHPLKRKGREGKGGTLRGLLRGYEYEREGRGPPVDGAKGES